MNPLKAAAVRIGWLLPDFDPEWDHNAVGRWGELWAVRHYHRERGAALLARNWRGGGGELDLVVRERETLVFVEVKTRDPRDLEPLSAVRDPKRLRHLRGAAIAYLRRLPRPYPPVRFDVILITPDPQNPHEPQIDCLLDAFRADDLI
ncbi:MAG: YraN family protein [Sumerlaeia bacterium]